MAETDLERALLFLSDSACSEMGAKFFTNTVVARFSLPPANLRMVHDLIGVRTALAKLLAEPPTRERTQRLDKLVQESLDLRKEAAQQSPKVRCQATKRAREVQSGNVPKRFAAVVEAVEQVLKVRPRPPGVSDTAYAKRIRDRVEAVLRKNGTMKGKRRIGVIMVRKALVAAEQRALSQKNSDAF
jgi:hypothetical protein